MDFYIELEPQLYNRAREFDPALGMWFWNMAVMIAPYDTGNLRRSITLARNNPKNINIRYSVMRANYLKFLELGVGPVKKHKGFISVNTRLAIVEQLIIYLKTGRKPMFTNTPYVHLRQSRTVFPKERAFLRSANLKTNVIGANTRRKISQIRELSYRNRIGIKMTSFSGLKVETSTTRSQKGVSVLNSFYRSAKRLT